MSILNVRLKKILQLFYANDGLRRSLLRADIWSDARKDGGGKSSTGGDFYGPFWADAKAHVTGERDLTLQTKIRIAAIQEELDYTRYSGMRLWSFSTTA
jgi:hypothetical protein